MTLELIGDFVNTRNLETGRESLTSPAALADWLREHELLEPGAHASDADLEHARELREALRALGLLNNGVDVDADVQPLEDAACRARLELAFAPPATARLEPHVTGVDAALGRIVATVAAAMADGTWLRFKSCRACQWGFVDNARNRSRTWCSMESCGNREKARTFRRRHGSATGRAP